MKKTVLLLTLAALVALTGSAWAQQAAPAARNPAPVVFTGATSGGEAAHNRREAKKQQLGLNVQRQAGRAGCRASSVAKQAVAARRSSNRSSGAAAYNPVGGGSSSTGALIAPWSDNINMSHARRSQAGRVVRAKPALPVCTPAELAAKTDPKWRGKRPKCQPPC